MEAGSFDAEGGPKVRHGRADNDLLRKWAWATARAAAPGGAGFAEEEGDKGKGGERVGPPPAEGGGQD